MRSMVYPYICIDQTTNFGLLCTTFSQLLSICVHFASFISAITSTKNRPIENSKTGKASAVVCFACSNMALVHRSPKLVVWSIQMYGHTIDHIFNGRNNVDY